MTSQDLAEQINALPNQMRDRIMERLEGVGEEQRARVLERVARMIASMTPEQREHLAEARKFMVQRNAKAPEIGDPVPDFDLALLDGPLQDGAGAGVRLSGLKGRPVGLIFGSYTWPPFRHQAGRLNDIYNCYRDDVEFFVVYIQEAHPSDGWQTPIHEHEDVVFAQPETMEQRVEIAQACSLDLGLAMPTLLDARSNEVDEAYTALPDRLYVVDEDGRIAYRSGPGPMGFSANEFEGAIRAQLGLEVLESEPQAAGADGRPAIAGEPAAAERVQGSWNVVFQSPMGQREATLELRADGGALEGTWATAMGVGEVSGAAGGDRVEWTVSIEGPMGLGQLAFSATVTGDDVTIDELAGEVQFGSFAGGTFSGKRA